MKSTLSKLATLTLTTVIAVFAQAQSRITVKVPFNFVISNKSFPAGQYSLSATQEKLTVQDSTGKTIFIGAANPVSGRRVGPTGQIIFHCYETRCFLSELWIPTRDNGSQLLASRYEREVARSRERTEFALLDDRR